MSAPHVGLVGVYDMLMFGLRLGDDPRVVVTTTPKPIRIIRELIADPTTVITHGSTYDNRFNLPAAFLAQIVKKYEGTRLGRQELNAELLDDVPGALWSRALLEAARPPMGFVMPDLVRVVVAIDPAASSGEDADETGTAPSRMPNAASVVRAKRFMSSSSSRPGLV